MKYKILIIAGLVGMLVSCEKEMSPEQADKFIKFYGSYLMDEAKDVALLDDGGYAFCGTGSPDNQGTKMVLVVTDKYGNLKDGFPKYYTEEGLESGANAMVSIRGGQGGFLLAGYVKKPLEDESPITATQRDIFLTKVSSTGQVNWQVSDGTKEDEVILHATPRISSGFMLAGFQMKDGNSDILIKGIDEQGGFINLNLNYNNPYAVNGSADFLLNTGDRYLCVCTYDKIGGVNGTDILVLNFDDELSPIDKNLTDDSNEYGSCIIEDGPDSYLVLGNRITSSGKTEIVVHRITTSGLLITKSELLATISESNMDLIGKRMVKTDDQEYAIVGTRGTTGAQEIFLQFLSDNTPSGRIIYGASGVQTAADIDLPDGGGIVLLGTSNFETNSMMSLIKTSDTGDL